MMFQGVERGVFAFSRHATEAKILPFYGGKQFTIFGFLPVLFTYVVWR